MQSHLIFLLFVLFTCAYLNKQNFIKPMFLDPDKSFNVFSSKGNLTQCDNALKPALNGSLSLGCSASDGCVLVSFKNLSRLVVKEKYHKVFKVCPSIGVTYSGLQPDFRVQLNFALAICQSYFDVYKRYPALDTFIAEFSLYIQEYTQKGGYRPFGTRLTFRGPSKGKPSIYQIDPSGSYRKVDVVSAGKGYDEARKFLTKRLENCDDNIVK